MGQFDHNLLTPARTQVHVHRDARRRRHRRGVVVFGGGGSRNVFASCTAEPRPQRKERVRARRRHRCYSAEYISRILYLNVCIAARHITRTHAQAQLCVCSCVRVRLRERLATRAARI